MNNRTEKLTDPPADHIIKMVIKMIISKIRHDWPFKPGFSISRPNGYPEYTFLHFSTPIRIRLNGEIIDARPGACIFYSAGTPQYCWSEADVIHNWMHATEELKPLLEQYDIPENCILYPDQGDFISKIFRRIETEYFLKNPHREELIGSYLTSFLIQFSRAIHGSHHYERISRNDTEKLRALRQEFLSKPEEHWSVSKMAKKVSLSTSRFHTVYKIVFGTSPINDVIEARISYARSLLMSDETLTLPQVAERLGYNDQYHFIRQFKAFTGQTPGQFRKFKKP